MAEVSRVEAMRAALEKARVEKQKKEAEAAAERARAESEAERTGLEKERSQAEQALTETAGQLTERQAELTDAQAIMAEAADLPDDVKIALQSELSGIEAEVAGIEEKQRELRASLEALNLRLAALSKESAPAAEETPVEKAPLAAEVAEKSEKEKAAEELIKKLEATLATLEKNQRFGLMDKFRDLIAALKDKKFDQVNSIPSFDADYYYEDDAGYKARREVQRLDDIVSVYGELPKNVNDDYRKDVLKLYPGVRKLVDEVKKRIEEEKPVGKAGEKQIEQEVLQPYKEALTTAQKALEASRARVRSSAVFKSDNKLLEDLVAETKDLFAQLKKE
ncbi:MAG: hypothetical protein V1716_03210 [Candidatus Uhrbacteria bacterium]